MLMNMKTFLRGAAGLFLFLAAVPIHAQTINLRLSVKIIVHPTTGARPSGVGPAVFTNAAAAANQWMSSYGRGYRYQITEVVDIGGPSQGGASGPSKWFGVNASADANWSQFQQDTQNNPVYLFRANAINYYVTLPTNWNTGGAAAFPWETTANGWRSCWGIVNSGPFWIVHECGHFFGLPHTHGGCDCPSNLSNCSMLNGYWVGDDGIADTLREGRGDNCFTTIDQITLANFNKTFANSTPAERALAQDTFYNVMSYHDPTNKDLLINRMTELQHDQLTTYANSDRSNVVSGFTRFVSTVGNNANSGLSSLAPKRTVLSGVNASAASGDIVLLRPGNYNEQITISKAVTLRATRAGWASVGKP
jgi:hypothetical protein